MLHETHKGNGPCPPSMPFPRLEAYWEGATSGMPESMFIRKWVVT